MERLSKALEAAARFNAIVDTVEARCLAADGPVTPTLQEMREDELRQLWLAVRDVRAALASLRPQGGGE